jgi:putative endonuclease
MGKLSYRDKGYRQQVGKRGENEAVQYLKRKGYQIIERNFRLRFGEIDIIAKDGPILVFIEVKTKVRGGFGEPEEWINRKKQIQISKVAMGYLQVKNVENIPCRFDVVAIKCTDGKVTIRHIEDAFWLDSPEPGGGF